MGRRGAPRRRRCLRRSGRSARALRRLSARPPRDGLSRRAWPTRPSIALGQGVFEVVGAGTFFVVSVVPAGAGVPGDGETPTVLSGVLGVADMSRCVAGAAAPL